MLSQRPMHSLQMLKLLTSGIMDIKNEETHHVQMKRLPPKFEIEERDLSTDDSQLIDQYKKETKKEYNMWWTPMMAAAATGRIPWAADYGSMLPTRCSSCGRKGK